MPIIYNYSLTSIPKLDIEVAMRKLWCLQILIYLILQRVIPRLQDSNAGVLSSVGCKQQAIIAHCSPQHILLG